MDILAVYLVVIVVYAILGVQLFAGTFGSCEGSYSSEGSSFSERRLGDGAGLLATYATRQACEAAGQEWLNPHWGSFDNVASSALLLFEMATLDGWTRVMYAGIDATGVDTAPVRDYAPARSFYFVLWIFVGSFVLLDLFIGSVVITYNEIQQEDDGWAILTKEQQAWTAAMEYLLLLQPKLHIKVPSDPCRAWCYHTCQQKRFDYFITWSILVNTGLMAADSYGASDRQAAILSSLNDLCTLIFITEAAIKVSGFGWRGYISEPWHRFDLLVVGLAVCDWFATLFVGAWGEKQPALVRVLRLTRVLRTLRVVRAARGLSMLLSMFFVSVFGLLNILGVFLIILFMYSLLAMQLFGRVAYGEYLNEVANFCSFPTALLTLFRCATGEDCMPACGRRIYDVHPFPCNADATPSIIVGTGNALMRDVMITPADGLCSEQAGDCGIPWLAVPFFVTFEIMAKFIILKVCLCPSYQLFSTHLTPPHTPPPHSTLQMTIALINDNYSSALKRDASSLNADDAEQASHILPPLL